MARIWEIPPLLYRFFVSWAIRLRSPSTMAATTPAVSWSPRPFAAV